MPLAHMNEPSEHPEILSVSQLNHTAKQLLESHLNSIWLSGEIANFTAPRSGHWYFSLKDDHASIRCAQFRGTQRQTSQPKVGDHVIVQGHVSLYSPRGDYQFIAHQLELTGAGALQRQFEELKKRLAAEGLFDAHHKKNLPAWPTCIGVITSITGAALRDILHVLSRRSPFIPVRIYPSEVQGQTAPLRLIEALNSAIADNTCDVLILARGGGSAEDLWCFNDEALIRALFACPIPIVSGVGHEIDFTLTDFVSDKRAPTPSSAAEYVGPDQQEWLARTHHLAQHLSRSFRTVLLATQHRLELCYRALKHPAQKLQEQTQTLDFMEARLIQCMWQCLERTQQRYQRCKLPTQALHWKLHRHIETWRAQLQQLSKLSNAQLRQVEQTLMHCTQRLKSPKEPLERGFALVYQENQLIKQAAQLQMRVPVSIEWQDGKQQLEASILEESSN